MFHVYLKPSKHSLGIKMKTIQSIPKYLNICLIKHKLKVQCSSFEKKLCTNQDIFQYTIHYEGKLFSCPWVRFFFNLFSSF